MKAGGGRRASGRARRRTIRRVCLALIGLLYLASVPWYRETGAPLRLWLGLPDWVAVALGCYVAVACVNAVAWGVTEIDDEPVGGGSPDAFEAPE